MSAKYSIEQVQSEIDVFELILDEYKGTKDVYAHDQIGYKYHFSLSNIRLGRKPDWLQGNPFALENVKLYLSINYPDYELLDNEYTSCKAKMRFICHKHEEKGIQRNSVDNIVHNHHACKYCGYSVLSELKRIPDSQLMGLCSDKNVEYVGRKQYDRQTHILYKCPIHNNKIQEMTLDHFRPSNVPCRYCQISSGELKVKNFLELHNIRYHYQYVFPNCKHIRVLEFDYYLPDYNIIIEYDGKQHYEMMNYADTIEQNMEQFKLNQKRDQIKNQYCIDNNIIMIRIPYWEYDNLSEYLYNELSKYINIESSETAG